MRGKPQPCDLCGEPVDDRAHNRQTRVRVQEHSASRGFMETIGRYHTECWVIVERAVQQLKTDPSTWAIVRRAILEERKQTPAEAS